MAVEACNEPKLAVDMEEEDDDAPIVFKRNSSSSKQNRLNQDTKASSSSSSRLDKNLGGPAAATAAQSTLKSDLQNCRMLSPSKTPLSTRVQKSSEEPSPVKCSPSVTGRSSVKPQVRDDKQAAESEDSEDNKPLSFRASKLNSTKVSKDQNTSKLVKTPKSEVSDDEMPLSSQFKGKPNVRESAKNSSSPAEKKPLLGKSVQNGSVSVDRQPLNAMKKRPADGVKSHEESSTKKPKLSDGVAEKELIKPQMKEEDDEEDYIPIAQRLKKTAASEKKQISAQKLNKAVSASFKKKTDKKPEKVASKSEYSKSSKVPPGSGEGQKWTTLVHNGVIFPPPYKPHGVKMLYKGKPVGLTPEQEEVATMFAVMRDSDYVTKDQFKENFMNDWRKILGRNHIIQSLEHCDFTPIYEWHQKEKEKKKQMTSEEKKALREEKLKQEEKYMWAIVDGVKEKVGNFRVEPPGLFRGRGEHPKMGRLKKRIHPSDIIINIGKDAPIPECPIPGERWKEVRHDNTVTWLAYWNDPINPKEFKYVFLAASSTLKGQSDKEKYEKARKLKNYISGIRATYAKDFTSKDPTKKQIAVATYLIDKLALRAGNEKDDDEADTVGCCTLKVENVEPIPPNTLKFDFLGKDSIKYENEVEVEIPVFKAIQQFRSGKKGGDDLFDKLDTSKLNAHLKELMPGLTAKVFRTYNASITLDEMLNRETKGGTVAEKVVVYQHANKEVAIICNHQRTVSKTHGAQMLRLEAKLNELKGVLEELKTDLSRAKKGKPPLNSSDGKTKRNLNPDVLERKIQQTTTRIEKMERDMETKEDLKTVALGTSKINYLDPRITVAWCKRHEVPIEKIFNKSLIAKFTWAMDVDPSFRF